MLSESSLCGLDGFADGFDAGEDGVDGGEVSLGGIGDDACEGGFAGAWWSVEDDGAELVGFDGASQQSSDAEDMVLADVFVEVFGVACERRGGLGWRWCVWRDSRRVTSFCLSG